ncbi:MULTISPECIES: SDR family NAD(P)-dependent oxidoreductase [unclassified Haladaptatus]|uniref:SDR family NAD(P)-dependent oxidoreductase n=1 Tax=unclassified Haladaptatus TaxID=2622732 RepID=UPI0023E8F8B0|nr:MULTISPECIES: 3-oxoacyl-ACP reductase family protein [unclassified Haladaptatus]
MSGQFDGQTAIVTGSSKGIGKAIAMKFAAEGANVVTNSRSYERAAETSEEIEAAGGTALPVETDVSDPDSVAALVDATVERFGRLDVMVNNAGMTIIGPAEEMDPADWQKVIDVDLSGVFYGSQAAGRQLIEQGDGGAIVNVSSMMGSMGLDRRTPYCAAKGGVDNMTRTLAVEWAEHDIHVNALAPGYIRTAITDQSQASAGYTDQDIQNRTPLGRYGSTEEMANCVLFLAAQNNFVTGEVLTADGGWSAYAWGSEGK